MGRVAIEELLRLVRRSRGALVLLAVGCHREARDAPAVPACGSPPERFDTLDRVRWDADPAVTEAGAGGLLWVSRMAVACGEASEVARSTPAADGTTTFHLARDGWRIDHVSRLDPDVADVVFTAPGEAARAPTALALDRTTLEAVLRSNTLDHEGAHGVRMDPKTSWTALEGPFTAPGARDEAVVTHWGGLSHHDGWQAWLLRRDASPEGWQALAELLVDCSGDVDAVDLDGDGRLELLIDSSCMHQGQDDGAVRVVRVDPTGLHPLLEARYSDYEGVHVHGTVQPAAHGGPEVLLRRTERGIPSFARYRLEPGGDRLVSVR